MRAADETWATAARCAALIHLNPATRPRHDAAATIQGLLANKDTHCPMVLW